MIPEIRGEGGYPNVKFRSPHYRDRHNQEKWRSDGTARRKRPAANLEGGISVITGISAPTARPDLRNSRQMLGEGMPASGGWQPGSCGGSGGIGTSHTTHREPRCDRMCRKRRIPSIAGTWAGIRCPTHNKDSGQSRQTFATSTPSLH